MKYRRGYQGKRFRLYDLENECHIDLTTDEVQVGFFRIEHGGQHGSDLSLPEMRSNNGEYADPGRCDVCLWRMQKHNTSK